MELGGGGGEDREGSVWWVCACVCLCVLLRVRAFQKISTTKSQTCGLDRGGCDPGAIRHDCWCVGWQKPPNKGSGRDELNEACWRFSGEKQKTALLR